VRVAGQPNDRLANGLLGLARRDGMDDNDQDVLIDAANLLSWDDAIHIAAPWDDRVTLCGNWRRNRQSLDEERPDGFGGCWSCLQAADWFDQFDLAGIRQSASEAEAAQ
jgi:hypothetical protein